MSNASGRLFVVATPIGNLEDLSARALATLRAVDCIAAEDTRHTGRLLAHYGIRPPALISLHEHNEAARVVMLRARLDAGESLALVSDAGTPLISDPGFRFVRALREAGITVSPVPGPCSIVAALSVSGLATDRFVYEGFLPAKPKARRERLEALRADSRTLVFLESGHRIVQTLQAMVGVFGDEREAVLARELTKAFETVRLASLGTLAAWVAAQRDQRRGELVVLVSGAASQAAVTETFVPEHVLDVLLAELPTKQAARLAARLTGASPNALYRLAVRGR